jgi:hypothetical protein
MFSVRTGWFASLDHAPWDATAVLRANAAAKNSFVEDRAKGRLHNGCLRNLTYLGDAAHRRRRYGNLASRLRNF